MYQELTIPAGTTSPILSFWTKITTEETTTTTAFDTMAVQIKNTSGAVLQTLKTFSNLDAGSTSGPYTASGRYRLNEFSLAAYVGQTIRVNFKVTTDAAKGTMFRVDDVSLAPPVPVVAGTSKQVVAYVPDYRYSMFSKMDLSHLTHINYFSVGFASNGTLSTPSATFNSHLDTVVAAAHAKGVGVSITTGPGQPYAAMGASAAARAKLVADLKTYVLAHNLDGVDIDWEPPAKGIDQVNYGLLIDDLYAAFNPIGKKITAAVNPWTKEIPVDASKKMSWINVMCYDFDYDDHSNYAQSTDGMLQWQYYGVAKDKLVMGVPFYGRYGTSWSNTISKTYGESATDPTRRIVENYKLVHGVDIPPTVDSYTDSSGNVTYFNGVRTMQMKQAFVRDQGFAGTMIWELGHDHWDANNKYDKFSLLPVVGSMIKQPAWLTTTVGSLHDLVNSDFYATLGTMTWNADPSPQPANAKLAVTINNGATIVLGASSHAASLSVDAGGKIDIKDKALVVDWTGASPIGSWNGTNYTGISGMAKNGAIMSSMLGADMVIGVAEASSIMPFTSGSQTAVWQGMTIDGSSVLVKRTYNGDANLDGVIDGDDFFAIDAHLGATGANARWHFGDFDRNGRIDTDDYFVLDTIYSRNRAPLPAAAAAAGAELPAGNVFATEDVNSLYDAADDEALI
jgi:GH18 family chitinase